MPKLTNDDLIYALNHTEGRVTGVITAELYEVLEHDLEGFLDLASERLVGSSLLMDVSLGVVDVGGEGLGIEVTGCVTEAMLEPGEFYTCERHRTGDIEVFRPNGVSLAYLQGDDTQYVEEALANLETITYPSGPWASYEAHLSDILDAYDYR